MEDEGVHLEVKLGVETARDIVERVAHVEAVESILVPSGGAAPPRLVAYKEIESALSALAVVIDGEMQRKTPDELLEVRLGFASAKDIIERAGAKALVALGNPKWAAERLKRAKDEMERAEAEALAKYFVEVKSA